MRIVLPEVKLPDEKIATPHGQMVVPGHRIAGRSLEIDSGEISQLLEEAREASLLAYAPFSKFSVGAALTMADDPKKNIFTGSNVENSSFGATNCAERTALFSASSSGFRCIRIMALAFAEKLPPETSLSDRSPCGICRQVLYEFADDQTLLAIESTEDGRLCDLLDIARLLPWGFRFQGKPTSG